MPKPHFLASPSDSLGNSERACQPGEALGVWVLREGSWGSSAAAGLPRHGSLQADVPVSEEELPSLHGAVTALSAALALHPCSTGGDHIPHGENSVLNLFLALHGRVGAGEGTVL